MKDLLKKHLNEQKGFTLIELLAVIVILGIILAIAIPAVTNIIQNSRIDAHISNAQQIESAAKLYYADKPTAASPVSYETLKEEGLLEAIEDPHTDNEYGAGTQVEKTDTGYKTTVAKDATRYYLTGKSASQYTRDDFIESGTTPPNPDDDEV